jgi:hypothetical protein
VSAEDYRFYAGKQDDDDALGALADLKRPASVYNEVKPKIDMLVGLAAKTKHEIVPIPVGMEDEPYTELISGTLKHYRKMLKLGRKELDCFEHMIKSGRSLLYYYIDDENPFKPKIAIKRFMGRSFYLDSQSVEYDLSDCRYLFLDKWLDEDDIKLFWPDINVQALVTTSRASDEPQFFNEQADLYRIVEAWYRRLTDVVWFQDPATGVIMHLVPSEFKKYNQVLLEGIDTGERGMLKIDSPLQGKPSKIKKMYRAIFSGDLMKSYGPSPYKWSGFPAVLFGAYKNDEMNSWFSAITMMKDPQRAVNTMERQLSHLLQTLPKGMLVHEVNAILNIDEYEDRSADPSFHLVVAQGAIDKVRFEKQPQISPIYSEFALRGRQGIKDAAGIQNEMMGVQTTGREPGVSIARRQETNIAVLYVLYDNYHESRELSTKILLSMIQQYETQPTMIRLEGDKGLQLLQVNSQLNPNLPDFNDISRLEFDITLDDVAEMSTMRGQITEALADYSHNNPGVIPPDLILEYTDIPYTGKQRVKLLWEEKRAQEAKLAEEEMALKRLEVETKLETAKAQRAAAERKPKEGSK